MKQFFTGLACIVALSSCNEFGKKVTNKEIEVYYKDGISEAAASRTAAVLQQLNASADNGNETKSMQLDKRSDTVILRMVAEAKKVKDMGDVPFASIGVIISDSVFGGKPVAVELTDDRFNPHKHIAFTKPEVALNANGSAADFGTLFRNGNLELYYKNGISAEEAQKMQAFLLAEINPANIISFQMLKNDQGIVTLNMASTTERAANFDKTELQSMAKEVSEKHLNGASVIFQITDQSFNPIQSTMHAGKL